MKKGQKSLSIAVLIVIITIRFYTPHKIVASEETTPKTSIDDVLNDPQNYIQGLKDRTENAITDGKATIDDTKEKIEETTSFLKNLIEIIQNLISKLTSLLSLFN